MIIYCCVDLIFATKIRSTAEALGVLTRPARDTIMLQKRLDQVEDGKPNDPVSAVFVDLEIGEPALQYIEQTKAHNASIPVVVFGSHVARDVLDAARERHADHVLPRSAFTAHLPALLEQYASRA